MLFQRKKKWMPTKLKIYMYFSRSAGPNEGAALVFAHTAKEAKAVGWARVADLFTDEYIDIGIRWLRDSDYLFKEGDPEKLKNNIPHANDSPTTCKACELWGEELNGKGYCYGCQEEIDLAKEANVN